MIAGFLLASSPKLEAILPHKTVINIRPKWGLMLNQFTRFIKRNRLGLPLRPITRRGRSLVSKIFIPIFQHKKIKTILGSNLAFALVATSIIPTNHGLMNIQTGTASGNLLIPQQTLDETFKPSENGVTITIGKTQIKTVAEAQMPVEDPRLTQGYRLFHPGVDLADPIGTPVKPIMPGVVEYTQNLKYDYGTAVTIDHGNGITSLYAHLSKILVKVGQKVDNNTVIGKVGETGRATGPHLHLEIRDHEIPVSPASVIPEINKLPFGFFLIKS